MANARRCGVDDVVERGGQRDVDFRLQDESSRPAHGGWTSAGHGLLHPEDGARQNGQAERGDQRQQIFHR